ncbi:MAG: TrkH family potassium uptake protein [Sediminimonas qiaohouensis]|uniref:TrkH family potassium uptake protein n=1 Tax=Sediminimonas qiaohouensis TaxID=552061 RepID=A0A7C9HB86_9RHOB|nr:potassium transporter TrkG [Sediminimonas qiaohouensis]MTJ04105.1 TrkH family potassium uptake protein [Sediminimonas qiaohouensis]
MADALVKLPLFVILAGIGMGAMYVPAMHALSLSSHAEARAFFYSGTLGLLILTMVIVALSGRTRAHSTMQNLVALLAAFTVLPLLLAVPFHEALQTTSFLNAYFEMVSSLTTTGAVLFDAERLSPTLHLWRALVGWLGGLLMWVSAAAILGPLNLGGFEVTATGQPVQYDRNWRQTERADPQHRVMRAALVLAPVYAGLTAVLWVCLVIAGDSGLTAFSHAAAVMATSGITPLPSAQVSGAGVWGEALMAMFMLFALSRVTFSRDTRARASPGVYADREFRLGLVLVLVVPLVMFARHWAGAIEIDGGNSTLTAVRALWGGVFTVLSFLTTTGFESAEWAAAQDWSGLNTTGLIFMGLAMIGGGVATTAGGIKLLRVWALYLNALREMERLVHPSSVGRARANDRRMRRQGAYIAWLFLMLFALTLAVFVLVLTALGQSFDHATVLAIAGLSTTGPLIGFAPDSPIVLADIGAAAKMTLCAAMVLGRLEMLAIIALISSSVWRE